MDKTVGNFPFDIKFQQFILQLMLKDEDFLIKTSQLIRSEYFSNRYLAWIYDIVYSYHQKYNAVPSHLVIKNEILKFPPEEQIAYDKVFDDVLNAECRDRKYLMHELTAFVQRAFFLNNIGQIADLYNKGSKENAYSKMRDVGEGLSEIDFDRDEAYDFSQILSDIESWKSTADSFTPIGIRPIDEALWGGVTKGDTVVFLGPTNIGKSLVLMNVARNAIEKGKKVLYLNLENRESQTVTRLISAMTNIKYEKIRLDPLTEDEKVKILMAKDKLLKLFALRSWYDPFLNIKKVYTYCKERFKKDEYDMIIIDYLQMISGTKEKEWQQQEEVMQSLELLARDLNVALVTAVQAKAEGQKKSDKSKGTIEDLLRLTDIGNSFGINRKTDIVITMTASMKDFKNNIIRFLLDKNRDGAKGIAVEVEHNFNCCKIFSPELRCKIMEWKDSKRSNFNEDSDISDTINNIVGSGGHSVQ